MNSFRGVFVFFVFFVFFAFFMFHILMEFDIWAGENMQAYGCCFFLLFWFKKELSLKIKPSISVPTLTYGCECD